MDNGLAVDEDDRMRWLLGLALTVASTGCTMPNPRSCADGLCTDPAFPYCDTDGALQGEPDTCLAVSCSPQEFVACLADRAVACNAAGNDYDVTQCPRGCDVVADGCKTCADSTQCSNPSPVCDLGSFECRECRLDEECESLVCDVDTGRCFATSEVIYASPTGSNLAACTPAAPCTAARAIANASASPAASTVRLLPGDYVDQIRVSSGNVFVVGTGARIDATNTAGVFNVLRGANITIRGLHFDLDHGHLFCGGGAVPTDLGGTLTLRDLTIESASGYQLDMLGCTALLRRVDFVGGSGSFILRDYSSLDGDRMHFKRVSYPLLMGLATMLTIKNSIFDHTPITLDPQDTGATTSRVVLAFNTFFTSTSFGVLYRQPTATRLSAVVENNIFLITTPGATNTVICPAPDCMVSNNVVFPQTPPLPASNIIMDPKLVNPMMGDMRLSPDSPALNAATTAGFGVTDHDFHGTMRPQGSAPDIGAIELVP